MVDWAFTALYYHGFRLGLGTHAGRWLGFETGTALDIMLPAVMKDSCIVGGDVTACQALMRAKALQYDVDLQEAQQSVLEAFALETQYRALFNGTLWESGAFLRAQLLGEIEARASSGKLILFLKAFAGDDVVRRFLIEQLAGDCADKAYGVLIAYFGYTPSVDMGLSLAPVDAPAAAFVANAAIRAYVMSGDVGHLEVARRSANGFELECVNECISAVLQ